MQNIQDMFAQDRVLRIAHRGASDRCPENTLPAFRQAFAHGADMVELDVQLTKDGSLVILHDHYLDRTTTGQGLVAEHTQQQIVAYDAGTWFDSQFAGTHVPLLDDVLREFPEASFNIELKSFPLARSTELVDAVLSCVKAHDAMDRVLLSSFDHAALHTARTRSRDIALGALYCGRLWPAFQLAEALRLTSLHPDVASLDASFIAEARAHGYAVLTWTVQTPDMLQWAIANGVSGVITDVIDMPILT
ncbi:glycerophosphoryl diester phosphodiesterase [Alicyclobacillus acidoterrestris]|nr:glycerophosphoryl diester phosphodiesterase [Alicyclobacillus acidoterrestris]